MVANMREQGATPSAAAAAAGTGNANAVGSDVINMDSDSGEIPDVLKEVWDYKTIKQILSSDEKQQWICL